jgi:hypothetical protein
MRSRCCVCACLCIPPVNFWMPEPIFMKLGTYVYVTALNPVSTAWLKNPSHQSVCLYVYPLIVARQRLGKNHPIVARQRLGSNVIAVTNTRATTEELLDASVSMWNFPAGVSLPCRFWFSATKIVAGFIDALPLWETDDGRRRGNCYKI